MNSASSGNGESPRTHGPRKRTIGGPHCVVAAPLFSAVPLTLRSEAEKTLNETYADVELASYWKDQPPTAEASAMLHLGQAQLSSTPTPTPTPTPSPNTTAVPVSYAYPVASAGYWPAYSPFPYPG
jgi:hypothetical protein